jgi:5-methylcytosine-specific restriction endonuclease McrA
VSDAEWESCKKYFDDSCAYCGLHISEHFNNYKGKMRWTDLHKEHVDDDGANDLSNCIPSCQSCNSQKWNFEFEEFYNTNNENYDQERYDKIIKWLNEDYKQFQQNK